MTKRELPKQLSRIGLMRANGSHSIGRLDVKWSIHGTHQTEQLILLISAKKTGIIFADLLTWGIQ